MTGNKVELKDTELGKVNGGSHIEPVDGLFHFKKNMVFTTYIDTSIKGYYTVHEDKDATLEDTISCYVSIYYSERPLLHETTDVSVAELVKYNFLYK